MTRARLIAIAAVLVSLLAIAPSAVATTHAYRGPLVGGSLLDGPCGATVNGEGDVYVADYFHREIGMWSHIFQSYGGQIGGVGTDNGPCGVAVGDDGSIYVGFWHGNVVVYPPFSGAVPIIGGQSTGIALDRANGDLYVNHRISVDVYEAPFALGEEPALRIGQGSLGDAYGVAVSSYGPTAGLVYVADAADDLVKVFDPDVDADQPVATIDGGGTVPGRFVSLADASLTVNGLDGHLFVVDNLQPGSEHPLAAVYEFNADGIYSGQIERTLIHGEPTGIAVNESFTPRRGEIYVSSGNGSNIVVGGSDPAQASSLLAFGPAAPGSILSASTSGGGAGTVTSKPAGISCGSACQAEFDTGSLVTLTPTAAPGSEFAGWSGKCSGTGSCAVSVSGATSVNAEFVPAPGLTATEAAAELRSAVVGNDAGATAPSAPTTTRRKPAARHRWKARVGRARALRASSRGKR